MRIFLLILLAAILITVVVSGRIILDPGVPFDAASIAAYIVFTLGFFELISFGLILSNRIFLAWTIILQTCLMAWSVYTFFNLKIHPAISVFLFFAAIMVILSTLSIKHKSFV